MGKKTSVDPQAQKNKVHTPEVQWVTEKQPTHWSTHVVGTLKRAALEKRLFLAEREDVEAEVVVLVLAGVVIS